MSTRPKLLFIDDDPRAGELFLRFSEGTGYNVEVFREPKRALENLREVGADLVITDLSMPGLDGIEVLRQTKAHNPDLPVIIVTGYSSVDSAIEALRLGATDFIKKPYDAEELLVLVDRTLQGVELRRENRLLRRQLKDERLRYKMIGDSDALQGVYAIIDKVADIRCNVIIQGESGTGKELVARAIHNLGPDVDQPFIVVDCGALTDTLLESELFGHRKGAFTGASHNKQGLLEAASGGTVFLDEIGNISDAMQTKLLRVVQEQQITRVGEVLPVDIDVRFIVASNQDLETMAANGQFRPDLYHRLNVVTIHLPPLRERKSDIPLLIEAFISEFAARYRRRIEGFDQASMAELMSYEWPGNVRELRNLVERHIALAEGPELRLDGALGRTRRGADGIDGDWPDLHTLERRYILKTLDHYEGNREKTAAALGINKSTLWRKLQHYDQEP